MTRRRKALLTLLAANLLPLPGLLFLGWSVVEPVMIYALEALIMGLFFLARIAINTEGSVAEKVVFLPFFGGFYFTLAGAELAFVLTTFFHPSHDGPTFLGMDPQELQALLATAVDALGAPWFVITLAGLFIAHLRSFVLNSMRPSERARDLEWEVFRPFGRVLALLVVVIPGGAFLYYHGSITLMAVLLVAMKTGTDLLAHHLEHRGGDEA
jgi:hypothetical protein